MNPCHYFFHDYSEDGFWLQGRISKARFTNLVFARSFFGFTVESISTHFSKPSVALWPSLRKCNGGLGLNKVWRGLSGDSKRRFGIRLLAAQLQIPMYALCRPPASESSTGQSSPTKSHEWLSVRSKLNLYELQLHYPLLFDTISNGFLTPSLRKCS